jgi:archaellum component FlaC
MEKPIDKGAAQFAADEIQRLEDRIKRLEREVEVLRLCGNKDCTAMADEALSKEAKL